MTLSSIPFLGHLIVYPERLADFQWIQTPFATWISSYFLSYVLMDLLLGIIYYPDCMNIVTGYIHHLLYALLMGLILSWEKQGIFLIAGIQELPTIVLALGHLHKPWRNDLAFGSLFFTTRILFHSILIALIFISWPSQPGFWLIPISVVPLHFYWFGKWVRQQRRLTKGYSNIDSEDPDEDTLSVYDEEQGLSGNTSLDRLTSFESI